MATETKIQTFVHKLEEGGWATWIRRAVLVAAVAYMFNLWMFKESGFRGLSHEKAIEQAQIAREIARGNGFSTRMIRPAALWQFQSNKGAFPLDTTPDTYHAPLAPYITAAVFKVTDLFNSTAQSIANKWHDSRSGLLQQAGDFAREFVYDVRMNSKVVIYAYDKIIASLQLIFYFLAVLVSYFTAKRLFDKRLALFGIAFLLVCQTFWDFALSGLPQMLLLFLFACATYMLVRAVEARYAGKSTAWWAVGTGALFGLLALTHGVTIFVFVGALVFVG